MDVSTKKPSELFPNTTDWPVKPPEERWLNRWHWLKDEEGLPFLAEWDWKMGWHWGACGKPRIEEMDGWTYLAVALPPVESP